MLAKIAPRFVISRVIQNSYYAEAMSTEILKNTFGKNLKAFWVEDSQKFFECRFYGFISTQPAPRDFNSQFEREKYEESVNKLAVFNETLEIFNKINEFVLEVRDLYSIVEKSITSSNFFAKPTETDPNFEVDVLNALERYNSFLRELQAFPEWHIKVSEEVGKWFLLIHNNLAESSIKRQLFSIMNKQEYFV